MRDPGNKVGHQGEKRIAFTVNCYSLFHHLDHCSLFHCQKLSVHIHGVNIDEAQFNSLVLFGCVSVHHRCQNVARTKEVAQVRHVCCSCSYHTSMSFVI